MELSFGQRVDDDGLVQPWFTHGALDWLKAQDLSDKNIQMFGAGLGDSWLARRCKTLYITERNADWLAKASMACQLNGIENVKYTYKPCDDCSGLEEYYMELPDDKIDMVIVDDAYRYECIVKATTMPKPLTLIVDNWQQSYVFMCPAAVDVLAPYENLIYEQADHQDHDGVNKWKTAIFFIK